MVTSGPGRPRHTAPRRPGATTREQILDAAAELFTSAGVASTSTRQIADAVGIRQASLYHHFATKDEILDALLAGTLRPVLALSQALSVAAAPFGPAVELHAMVAFDAGQLLRSRWNLGVLYVLPELTAGPPGFRADRLALFERYRDLSARVSTLVAGPRGAENLTFHLVESIVTQRHDAFWGVELEDVVTLLADTCLRALGWSGSDEQWTALRRDSAAVLRLVTPPSADGE